MLAKFARNMTLMLGLWEIGCIPCGFDEKQTYETPEHLNGSDLKNGTQNIVGQLSADNLSRIFWFFVARGEIREAPELLTYSLEVYDPGISCPPDPASKLIVLGTATATSYNSVSVKFNFSWPASLQALDGKVLVLRAADQAQEPTVGVVCTTPLAYSPSVSMVNCSGM